MTVNVIYPRRRRRRRRRRQRPSNAPNNTQLSAIKCLSFGYQYTRILHLIATRTLASSLRYIHKWIWDINVTIPSHLWLDNITRTSIQTIHSKMNMSYHLKFINAKRTT